LFQRREFILKGLAGTLVFASASRLRAIQTLTAAESLPAVGDSPDDPGPLARNLSARLYAATGDRAYLDYMDHEWWITSGTLYDTKEHLYYRDSRYFEKREENGQKLFWSRGNGWVMGGLARVLQYLPADYPTRARYIVQLQQMATRLKELQCVDGLWRSGLLDEDAYKMPEVSGSALIAYGMMWGINAGILDSATFLPTVQNAWSGMIANIYQDGRLGCIQPVDAAPGQFKRSSSYVYGVGGFLLLGSEIVKYSSRGKQPSLPKHQEKTA
jgi:unsaturated rhamnogalacturonyl hydrolase